MMKQRRKRTGRMAGALLAVCAALLFNITILPGGLVSRGTFDATAQSGGFIPYGVFDALSLRVSAQTSASLLVDDAGLLDESAFDRVQNRLEAVSEKQGMDVAVVTAQSLGGKDAAAYADDYYDSHGYADDGVLFLIGMEERDWYISTFGDAVYAFTDASREYMEDEVIGYLRNGDYEGAFLAYADAADALREMEQASMPYGSVEQERGSRFTDPGAQAQTGGISLLLGALLSFIYMRGQKNSLKTVRTQKTASAYVFGTGVQMLASEERFLNRTVDRQPIAVRQEERGRSGSRPASTTHQSSSGRTHGGYGGKF